MAPGTGIRVRNCTAVKKANFGEMACFAFSLSLVMPDTLRKADGAIGEIVRTVERGPPHFLNSTRMPIETIRCPRLAGRVELVYSSDANRILPQIGRAHV